MKKIFVWNSYGDSMVIDASTIVGLQSIYNEILGILEDDWGNGDDLVKIKEYHAKVEKNIVIHQHEMLVKAINALLKVAEIGSHETFEYGTGFTKLKSTC